ncbi:MAG: alpha/beta hydrolase [Burkholderiales bacterium]|nr:alpha/beta hydrolase [Burkholderiales bacterium]
MRRKPLPLHAADLQGIGRLAIDATLGVTRLVETMHHNISRAPLPLGKGTQAPARGITGLVYRSIRGVTRAVGGGADFALAQLAAVAGRQESTPVREAMIAALNGVMGDHLAATGNPLAIAMRLRREGKPLDLHREALARAIPEASERILLLVHGLCRNDLQWRRNGHDHGAALAAAPGIAPPFTPVYAHYNTGLHVAANGRELAALLERLVAAWPVPVEEIAILAHSMGGLVVRSAFPRGTGARRAWPRLVKRIVFLGTPHDGAPLERGGRWIDAALDASPYTTAFARLGRLRSAGINDLRHGADRPLPDGVRCFAVAASLAKRGGRIADAVVGDGLVPVPSALGEGSSLAFPARNRWVARGLGHLDLLDHPAVHAKLRRWLG